jgi:hypothetical protein
MIFDHYIQTRPVSFREKTRKGPSTKWTFSDLTRCVLMAMMERAADCVHAMGVSLVPHRLPL